MDEFINKIKTTDGKEYTVTDNRLPEPTIEDAGKVVTIDENGKFCLALSDQDNLEDFLNNELTEINYKETIGSIRPYIFNNNQALRSFSVMGVENNIGTYAFTSSESLNNLSLGIVNGEIGDYAFAGLVNVTHFSLDPESNITKLGTNAFGGIGADRNSAERFVFDFRNSTFKGFQGFGIPAIPGQYDSATQSELPGTPGIGMYNADIYLPETVIAFGKDPEEGSGSSYGGGSGSGSGGILNCCENIDLYITNKEKVLELSDLSLLPEDENSHIYVPFEIYADYSLATNWAAFENLIGYIENSVIDSILPIYDTEGYELAWYKDKALTEATTLGTGSNVYCTKTGSRLRSKVVLGASYKGTIQITSASDTFDIGELIPVNTEITITPVGTELGEPVLSLFKVDDVNYNEPVTLELGENNINVSVYYNIEQIPDYFKIEPERSYSPSSEMNTLAYNNNYSFYNLPSHINIQPYYIQDGNIYEVKYLKGSIFQYKLKDKDYYVTLPDTLLGFGYGCFSGCTGLKSINIPSTTVYISNQMFYDCHNLEDIGILPKEIWQVDFRAFGACNSLTNKNIYYEGKPGDLYITIYDGSPDSDSNKPFKDALCYYSEEAPTDCMNTYKFWHYVDGEPVAWPPVEHDWGEWEVIIEPEGCKPGLKRRVCKNNPAHIEEEVIPAQEDHTDGEPVIENRVEPTFELEGSYDEVVYCSVCGDELSRTHIIVPRLEHNYSDEWSFDENNHWHACIDTGYEYLRKDEAPHRADHSQLIEVVPPTDTCDGYSIFKCIDCEATCKDNIVKPEAFKEYELSLHPDWQYYIINRCTKSEENLIVPSSYNGKPIKAISTGAFRNNASSSIILPDTIESIGVEAFYNNYQLKSIKLSSRLKSIDSGAFRESYNLKTIFIPSSVETMRSPFNTSNMTFCVELDEEVAIARYGIGWITTDSTVYYSATEEDTADFSYIESNNKAIITGIKTNSNTITIPAKINGLNTVITEAALKTIPAYLARTWENLYVEDGVTANFNNWTDWNWQELENMNVLQIPEGISILYWGDIHCKTLKIPRSVTTLDGSNFGYIGNIIVSEANTSYSSIDGSLFSKDKSNLLYLKPSIVKYTVPETITTLNASAFSSNSLLKSLTIPETVTAITGNSSARIIEIINKSSLGISAGSYKNGNIAWYAKYVTKTGESRISINNELIYYTDTTDCYLLGTTKDKKLLANLVIDDPNITIIHNEAFISYNNLRSVIITSPVRLIGQWAFSCNKLANIKLPNTLTILDEDCFAGTAITQIELPNSLTKINWGVFSNCAQLVAITIPDSVTLLGISAFNGCASLRGISIPEGITKINSYTFRNCRNLMTVSLPSTLLEISTNSGQYDEQNAFYGCKKLYTVINKSNLDLTLGSRENGKVALYAKEIIVDESESSIITDRNNNRVFIDGDSKIYLATLFENDSIIVTNDITEISDYAWQDDTRPVSFESNSSVKILGAYAFSARQDQVINLPNSLELIKDHAFYNCASLNSIVIPDKISELKESIFEGCSSLTDIVIPRNIVTISNSTFKNCTSFATVNFQTENLSAIGYDAFYNTALAQINIPDTVITIGGGAFANCKSLTTVRLPENLTELTSDLFEGCTALKQINIPKEVLSVGQGAFDGCDTNIIWDVDSKLSTIDCYAFRYYNGESLIIPKNVKYIGNNSHFGTTFSSKIKTFYWEDIDLLNGPIYDQPGSTLLWEGLSDSSFNPITSYIKVSSVENYVQNRTYSQTLGYRVRLVEADTGQEITEVDLSTSSITELRDNSFRSCTNITSIKLPKTLASIGAHCFSNISCPVIFDSESNIETIDSYAFAGYQGINIVLPQGTQRIGSFAFSNCSNLAKLELPGNIVQLGESVFEGCRAMSSIILNTNLETVGSYAFEGCSALISISIPASVTSIGWKVFQGCTSLETITVAEENQNYCADDNILYTKDKTKIVACPEMKTEINLVEGVISIDIYAFDGFNNLVKFTLPSTITKINSFGLRLSLSEIYYRGTIEMWNLIELEPQWRSSSIITVHCSDGDISL